MMESAPPRLSGALLTAALLLVACGRPAPACTAPADVRVFEAAHIGEQWIDYMWLELPARLLLADASITTIAGAQTPAATRTPACPSCERPSWGITPTRSAPIDSPSRGRLFIASADPAGAIVPTMIDLPCAAGPVDYEPALVDLEFDAPGSFKASYGWRSCAACSECYMHWTFSLDVRGQIQDDTLRAELVLNETFHSGPMKLVTLEMEEVSRDCTQPRLRCSSASACDEIRYVRRQ